MKKHVDQWHRPFLLENIASVATIVAGFVVIVGLLLGWIDNQTTVNFVIISLLCLFAISEVVQRTVKLKRIEEGIAELLRARDGKFIKDIDFAWSKAIKMVEAVSQDGYIFDTTSIKNKSEYEQLIEKKACEGVQITRLVCSSDSQADMESFIRIPSDPGKTLSIHHLPYSLPIDILITQQRDSINAILGFRTSLAERRKYSSLFWVLNKELAYELLAIYDNVLLPEIHNRQEKVKVEHHDRCKICNEIHEKMDR